MKLSSDISGPRVLVVGTPLAVVQLTAGLQLVEPSLEIVGTITGPFDHLEAKLATECVDQVLLTLPAALAATIAELAGRLDRSGVTWKFLPVLADQLAGRSRTHARLPGKPGVPGVGIAADIDPLQLLRRRPRPLDEQAIGKTLHGRVVMITGAGGSIGSELAQRVARFKPGRLVLVDRSENGLFEIDRLIGRLFASVKRTPVLHNVADAARTRSVVALQHPAVIFHAAAHKHVPMMEDHPQEAVENNFYGIRAIADAADAVGVDRFVMISTDKAVNPSSVMGATKRLAELYIQRLNQCSKTTFCMVRFGNVLGSACSVLPIWTQQLAGGGPITVTHPDMTRYFMTIAEAAGLVLQSASLCDHNGAGAGNGGGEVFVLDMGQPITIMELARRFITWHGLEPGVDIDIAITGIRPGEKLYEELVYDSENMLATAHESIRILRNTPPSRGTIEQIIATFDRLRATRNAGGHHWQHAGRDAIVMALRTAVPEMVQAAAG